METCIIDNGSTDGSLAIAQSWQDRGVFRIENFDYPGYYDLQAILSNKQRLAEEINADWFMLYDADEIREAPVPGETLQAAISEVDEKGYNAINFDEFVFLPCQDDGSYEATDYVKGMKYYYFFEPNPVRQVKGWKKGVTLDLVHTGGHRISKDALNIAPDNFIMRHYIALSADYAIKKYTKKRIYSSDEIENRGWHGRRATFTAQDLTLPDRQQLKYIEDGWDKSDVWHEHAFLGNGLMPAPFIVGVGRSGTTLLRLMLDAHSELAIPAETHFLPKLFSLTDSSASLSVDQFLDCILAEHTWHDLNLSVDEFRTRLQAIDHLSVTEVVRVMYVMYREKFGKKLWGDKTPLYQLHMELISRFLPEAHFIHIIRDGRDVALSMRQLWFGPGNDLRDQARNWCDNIRECRNQAKRTPFYIEVRYEELINNPEKVLREICDFIQLPFSKKMLDYHLTSEQRLSELGHRYTIDGDILVEGKKRRGLFEKTGMKPDNSRVERWRKEMSEQELDVYESVAAPLLKELGYKL